MMGPMHMVPVPQGGQMMQGMPMMPGLQGQKRVQIRAREP